MPEIKHKQPGGSPDILSAEIHIPNDADLGTGYFTTAFRARALSKGKEITSAMMNAPSFQISVTVNANGNVAVLIGAARPQHEAVFVLPNDIDRSRPHAIKVEFATWRIVAASIDDTPLSTTKAPTDH